MALENRHELPYSTRHFPWEQRKESDVWPDGARMAVSFYVAAEEWEWDEIEPGPPKRNRRDEHGTSLSTQTGVMYGFDVGLRRMADVFDDKGVSTTFFTTGNAVEQHPDALRRMHDRGHEITAHHFSEGRGSMNFDLEGMREDVRKTADLIEELTGERPVGWLGPGAVATEETIQVLAEEGFLYNADLQDDELPYFIDVSGETLVVIPYRMIGNVNDYNFATFTYTSQSEPIEDALDNLTQTFDAYYRAASETPLFFYYGTHPYVSGRPDAAYVLGEFIDHIQGYGDVWIPTYRELAEWWTEQYEDGYV